MEASARSSEARTANARLLFKFREIAVRMSFFASLKRRADASVRAPTFRAVRAPFFIIFV
jgi:hypothetical protein